MRTLLLIATVSCFFTSGFSQNYLGYSKQYILKALKSQRSDMKGPVTVNAVNDNYIAYIGKDGRRVVYYHFKQVTMTSETGKKEQEEICIKYISKNKCESASNCPEMSAITRSLDSHFTSEEYLTWVDYTKSVPHQWVVVRDENYFEVHVTELW